ncbi:hypothetical protein [Nocardioides sp.]|uniref:hypothetical protein n=1 Tax=Nocardioides sp. TaxID=35761 RepID=UPI0035177832
MSPRGPLPASVYWRRRIVVLVAVSLPVLGLVNLVRGGDGPPATSQGTTAAAGTAPGDTASTEDATGAAEPSADGAGKGRGKKQDQSGTTDPAESTDPTGTTAPVEPVEPVQPVLPTSSGPCDDAEVQVEPFVAGAVAGQPVVISLRLRTTTTAACTWQVDADHLALKVSAGADPVWASWDCPRQIPGQSVTVYRDTTTTLDLAWNARFSEVGCPAQPAWAQAGEYTVRAAAYGGEPSDEVTFTLAEPTAPSR